MDLPGLEHSLFLAISGKVLIRAIAKNGKVTTTKVQSGLSMSRSTKIYNSTKFERIALIFLEVALPIFKARRRSYIIKYRQSTSDQEKRHQSLKNLLKAKGDGVLNGGVVLYVDASSFAMIWSWFE